MKSRPSTTTPDGFTRRYTMGGVLLSVVVLFSVILSAIIGFGFFVIAYFVGHGNSGFGEHREPPSFWGALPFAVFGVGFCLPILIVAIKGRSIFGRSLVPINEPKPNQTMV
jgi:hypothetical protein